MVSTRKGKRYANEQLESETPPPKTKEKKPRLSKPNLSDDKAQALSDHKKSMGQEVVHKLCLPAAPSQFDVPSVSLFTLIEYAVQNTLREITILSELLPRKKMITSPPVLDIWFNLPASCMPSFLNCWPLSNGFKRQEKLRNCLPSITSEAAERKELHFARLPVFSVDALAAGHIKRIWISTYRSRFDTIVVKDGMVILRVSGEFEISITPLMDAYFLLHSFCLRLQLDVLFAQVAQMSKTCSAYVQVEDYSPADCRLVIGYWLKPASIREQLLSIR
uniref:Uncharacterized protein n=1 Tax=Ditylenchus dipsaci TaxID=166011 RepID=A0A915DZ83_9BILA